MKKQIILLMLVLGSGCTKAPIQTDGGPVSVSSEVLAVADAIPKYEKRTRAGNPDTYEVFGKWYKVLKQSKGYKEVGVASWYGTKFHGRKTSNGEVYNMYAMTAAHKILPIPCYVRVTNLENKHSVVVRVNDRGPFHENRIIDLSYTAAAKLGIQQAGVGRVEVIALGFDSAEQVEQKTIQFAENKLIQSPVIYLQVGAFSHLANASKLQEKLATAAIVSTRIEQTKKQHNGFYKVQVGPFYSEQQAKKESKKLNQIGFKNALLIIEKAQ